MAAKCQAMAVATPGSLWRDSAMSTLPPSVTASGKRKPKIGEGVVDTPTAEDHDENGERHGPVRDAQDQGMALHGEVFVRFELVCTSDDFPIQMTEGGPEPPWLADRRGSCACSAIWRFWRPRRRSGSAPDRAPRKRAARAAP